MLTLCVVTRFCGQFDNAFMKSVFLALTLLNLPAMAAITISNSPSLNEYIGTHFQTKDGRNCFIIENIPDFAKLEANLWQACEDAKGQIQPAKQILKKETTQFSYIQNAQVLSFKGKTFLYFNAYNENKDLGFWGRVEVSEKSVGPIEWLKTSQDLKGQHRAWIYPKVLKSGEMLLTYEALNPKTKKGDLYFSLSKDGLNFSAVTAYQQGAQMTRFEEFADGTWAFVYQVGYAAKMMDYIRLSKDKGKTFSEPIAVSSQENIHDPIFLKRTDGDLDVYYLVWHGSGFALHRRHVKSEGSLGAEEKLTDSSLNVQKPTPVRYGNGSVLVIMGKVVLDPSGMPHSDLMGLPVKAR